MREWTAFSYFEVKELTAIGEIEDHTFGFSLIWNREIP